jgi:hypothetical protein
MRNCSYCEEKGLTHVHSNDMVNALDRLSKSDRTVILKFMGKVKSSIHHTTVAEHDIQNAFCVYCGSDMERDDDGDRYYYLCTNNECPCWNSTEDELQ